MTTTSIPRFDLLKMEYYEYIGVQFSRGCPFNCEFCDIIELYGRVPRTKTNEQILAELDALLRLGYRGHVDFVDDNLIGNKKSLKRFLPLLKQWQKEHGYPFKFSTEASINLSDDRELLRMLREANFLMIFVGIESPNTDTLILMQKKQNTRRSLAESIHRIYGAGIIVIGGFVMGFDDETDGVTQSMIECINATSIPLSVVGLLIALPNTQLSRRLEKEGRLFRHYEVVKVDDDYQCSMSLNFTPLRPRRDILADYSRVLQTDLQPRRLFRTRQTRWPPARSLGSPGTDGLQLERAGQVGPCGVAHGGSQRRCAARVLGYPPGLRLAQPPRSGAGRASHGVLSAPWTLLTRDYRGDGALHRGDRCRQMEGSSRYARAGSCPAARRRGDRVHFSSPAVMPD